MQQTIKLKIKEYNTLNLKGIEILEAQEKSGDDLSLLRLRDSITGTVITLQQSSYSDFFLASNKPKETKKVFVLTGKINGLNVEQQFDTESEANKVKELNDVTEAKLTEKQVEIE